MCAKEAGHVAVWHVKGSMSLLLNFVVNYKVEGGESEEVGPGTAQLRQDLVCHAQCWAFIP